MKQQKKGKFLTFIFSFNSISSVLPAPIETTTEFLTLFLICGKTTGKTCGFILNDQIRFRARVRTIQTRATHLVAAAIFCSMVLPLFLPI